MGQAGEKAVGIVGPKTRIQILGTTRTRIPDQLTRTTLTEVKNVSSLSLTQQLRDFITFSKANHLRFELYVRFNTELSGPLQGAILRRDIILKEIPGL
ncbi:hypothetical protein HYR99_04815 [Candidatus Poribacteria bacterium]|nr:hypothetical protein [Candidatus Poribacteria bacterium]